MPPSRGDRLGPYEILSRIGAGGMGEVWKGRDTRLDRLVAIKFARSQFSDRFEREARVIAQLNHSHICTLHDVGPDYLVMEFVDGEPIKGPLPLPKALLYAKQICDALEAAHRNGITHRDLKPDNILLTNSGVKLLDFGLAKVESVSPAADGENWTNTLTVEGMILGTPPYMAPEQIEGKAADTRTDIFALGCVIYEMVTGKRAFDGKSASLIAAAILAKDPAPLTAHSPVAPLLLEQIVRTCLAKDPDNRFQTVRDVRLALEWVSDSDPSATRGTRRLFIPWLAAAVLVLACVALPLLWRFRSPVSEPLRIPLTAPGFRNADQFLAVPQPSPDATQVLFTVFNAGGARQLAVLSLGTGAMTLLERTEEVRAAAWSPDGRSIAFLSRGKLRKISTAGGNPQTIADISTISEGLSWGANGEILYAPSNRTPLFAIPDSGGQPVQVTKLDSTRAENSHRNPVFLPDGNHYLFSARSTRSEQNCVYLGSRRSGQVFRLEGINSSVHFAPVRGAEGWLVYARDGTLQARMFNLDTGRFRGAERRLVERVAHSVTNARAAFHISSNGRLLIYSETNRDEAVFQQWTRSGQMLRQYSFAGPGALQIRLSPDDRRLLFTHPDERTGNRDIWIFDLERDSESRLTSNPANEWWGVWASDGKGVYFISDRISSPTFHVFFKHTLETSGAEEQVQPALPYALHDVSRDGRWLLLSRLTSNTQNDLLIADLHGKTPPELLLDTEFDEPFGRFSPDGRWLAYVSNESGRYEAYVRRLAGARFDASPRILASRNGGEYPVWDPSGNELYYLGVDRRLYAVRFDKTGPAGEPKPAFRVCGVNGFPGEGMSASWDMPFAPVRGGQQFILRCRPGGESSESVFVYWDWARMLQS